MAIFDQSKIPLLFLQFVLYFVCAVLDRLFMPSPASHACHAEPNPVEPRQVACEMGKMMKSAVCPSTYPSNVSAKDADAQIALDWPLTGAHIGLIKSHPYIVYASKDVTNHAANTIVFTSPLPLPLLLPGFPRRLGRAQQSFSSSAVSFLTIPFSTTPIAQRSLCRIILAHVSLPRAPPIVRPSGGRKLGG